MIVEEIGNALWFILPAWIGNMLACTFGGGSPIDRGKSFIDGRPILGKGKTVRGLCVGITTAIIMAVIQSLFKYTFNPLLFGFLMGSGAMLGDMVKSFFKRRLNIESGKPLPLFDQLDFIAGALAMYYIFGPYLFDNFYALGWQAIVIIVVLTPLAHLSLNVVGYKLNMQDVWW